MICRIGEDKLVGLERICTIWSGFVRSGTQEDYRLELDVFSKDLKKHRKKLEDLTEHYQHLTET